MMPTVGSPAVVPLTCQVTIALVVLVTVAVKSCDPPVWRLAVPGATDTLTGAGGGAAAVMVTCAEPDWDESAADTAATVTVAGDGTTDGAV
jgi:hypothetical protein